MIRNKYNQGICQACGSFHWAILLDPETYEAIEYKCCRCKRIVQPKLLKRGCKNEKE